MDIIRLSLASESDGYLAETDQFYQVSRISESGGGELIIQATHFPADEGGGSLVAADMGASTEAPVLPPIPQPPPAGPVDPTPGPVPQPPKDTIGVLSVAPTGTIFYGGQVITLTASVSGDAPILEYEWAGPSGSSAPFTSTTGNVLTWTATGPEDEGTYTVTAIAPSATDSPKRVAAALEHEGFIKASGGSITYSGDYKVHTFVSSGQFNVSYTPGNTQGVECLLVGAGGNGSPDGLNTAESSNGQIVGGDGGGGGGGGVLVSFKSLNGSASYSVQVGRPSSWSSSKNGNNHSSVFGLTALCGGDGSQSSQAVADGGCGGGAGAVNEWNWKRGNGYQGGSGSWGMRHNIGGLVMETIGGGGGASGASGTSGSAGGSGSSRFSIGGYGGEGVANSISGSNYVYGSGGGGFSYGRTPSVTASEGLGGTGAGSGAIWQARSYPNRSGGTPGRRSTNYGAGGSGGDSSHNQGVQGVVIIRYRYR